LGQHQFAESALIDRINSRQVDNHTL
jgi:hypothetical protein